MPTQEQLQNRLAAAGQAAAPVATTQTSPIANPFSAEGAARIAQIAGQQPAPISANVLSTPQITVPPAPQTPIPDYSKLTVSTPIVNTPEQDRLKTERTGLADDIVTGITQQGQRSARKAELETAAGIPGLNSQLNELNTLIRNTQAEAFAATEKSENRLAPTFAIRGEQAQIERQRAVKVYGWAAAAEAIQGNIALAQDNVERALAAEFDPLEAQIEAKKFLLNMNRDSFDTEEKRRADLRMEELNKEEEALAEAREVKKGIQEIMLEAAKNGAANAVLRSIQGAQSIEEALTAAGPSLATPDTQVISLGDGRAVLIDAKTGATLKTYGTATGPGAGIPGGGVSEFGTPITPTAPPKAPTEGETASYVFFERMKNAVENIDRLEAEVTKLGTVGQLQLKYAPDILLSPVLQQYRQAQREFTEARLRKDSGAAIPPEEFENDRQTYFPQPGNGEDTLKQKATSRQVALNAVRSASGNKYWQVYGQSPNVANTESTGAADAASLRNKYNY